MKQIIDDMGVHSLLQNRSECRAVSNRVGIRYQTNVKEFL